MMRSKDPPHRSVRPMLPAKRVSPAKSLPGCAACSAAKPGGDRKSTRLNSSHLVISYAVFCLKKKKKKKKEKNITKQEHKSESNDTSVENNRNTSSVRAT